MEIVRKKSGKAQERVRKVQKNNTERVREKSTKIHEKIRGGNQEKVRRKSRKIKKKSSGSGKMLCEHYGRNMNCNILMI